MNRFLSLFSVSIIFLSCVSTRVENILDDVDSYIFERPDSALTVLESLDRNLLTTQKSRAHHALLYAMALDKNFINVDNDSIALVAVDYYTKHADNKYKARAFYYLGLSYYYSLEYDKAIQEFTKAEEVAQKCDSLYWGMTMIAQADTYINTYNEVEEYNCLCKAYEIYDGLSAEYYLDATRVRIARHFANQKSYAKSDSLLMSIIGESDIDYKVKAVALVDYAYSQAIRGKSGGISAVKTYEEVSENYDLSFMSLRDYWAWAYALHNLGREDESDGIVNQLLQLDTTITAEYWQYVFAKEIKDYKRALHHLEKTVEKNELEVENVLKQELSLKQRDYHRAQSELYFYKMSNRTKMLCSIVIIVVMIVGYILIFIKRYIHKQQEEKQRYMEYVAEIMRQLDSLKNEDRSSLKRRYIDLYKSKFEVLRSLSDQYLLTENRVDAEEKMYRKVVSLVNQIRNDEEHRAKFESMLDNDLDGIMSKIRQELPRLKEIDYAIFSYWIIGFDVTTISRLLDTNLNIIYIRKTRIKQQIKETRPEHMEQFLEMIS